jgi:hypothetical protein
LTDHATTARDSAQHCEAKKHALRQTQDGIVVAFVLHPNDVPPSLQLAPLGTRYMLALVEIADDETPVTGKEATTSVEPQAPQEPAPPPKDHTARASSERKWHEITPAQQAGIRCNEVPFVKFLGTLSPEVKSTKDAAMFVRGWCDVDSRSDIRGVEPVARWHELESRYRSWLYAPQVGAA